MWLAKIVRGSHFWRTIDVSCCQAVMDDRYKASPWATSRVIAQRTGDVGLCVTAGVAICIAERC